MNDMVETKGKTMTLKKKILINVLVNVAFAVVFLAIYQIAVLGNIDIFGRANTDGGLLPRGFSVQKLFFIIAVANVVLSTGFWAFQKLGIKLLPMLLVAVLVPIISYSANHSIFINGSGALYKEKQTVVMGIKKEEKEHGEEGDSSHIENMESHSIFIAKQNNGKFNTYLYINEDMNELYLYSAFSDNAKVSYNKALVSSYHYMHVRPEDETPCVISFKKGEFDSVEIYKDRLYLVKDGAPKRMFYGNCFDWIVDSNGGIK